MKLSGTKQLGLSTDNVTCTYKNSIQDATATIVHV